MRISDWSSDVCSSDLVGLLVYEGIESDPGFKDALWAALGSLASAPMGERTLTGLCALLQENRLRQALAPYVLDGPHGRLLDAEGESLGEGDVQAFEMEQLLPARGAALPVDRKSTRLNYSP